MNLKQVSHIIALAETLSFSKAAANVHLSQSALSKSIALLEEEIGIQIFERTTNKVEVTPSGRHVLAHARHLWSEATSFRKNIEYLKTGALGGVSVGSGPFPATCFLDAAVREFHRRYPKVSLTLNINHWGNLLTELHAGKIDFFMADIRNIDDDPMLDFTPVGGLTLALFCDRNHPLVADDPQRLIAPTEILDYTLASVSLPTPVFLELKQSMGLGHNDTFAVNIECDDIALINRLIPGSDILFVSSNLMMEEKFCSNDVVKLNIPMARNRFGEWALVKIKNRTLTPSASLLADLLVDLIRTGSAADNEKHGFAGNKPLNFLTPNKP